MHVIAGKNKGHSLKTLSGRQTRPTASIVKEALFQMLGPFFPGGTVIDLYAGSGSLGIEAVSRGMDKAIFVESNRQAQQVIKENIKSLGTRDCFELLKMPVKQAFHILDHRQIQADLILLDPPYADDVQSDLVEISQLSILRAGGVLVAETNANVTLAEKIGDLNQITTKDYGLSRLHFYRLQREKDGGHSND